MPAPAPESLVAMLMTLFTVPPRRRRPGVSLSLRQIFVRHRLVHVDRLREYAVCDGPVHVGAPLLRVLVAHLPGFALEDGYGQSERLVDHFRIELLVGGEEGVAGRLGVLQGVLVALDEGADEPSYDVGVLPGV